MAWYTSTFPTMNPEPAMFPASLLPWLPSGWWLTPTMGVIACAMAYCVGRRVLEAKRKCLLESDEAFEVKLLGGVTRDRRSAPRRRGNATEILVSTDPEKDLLQGWVIDRAIGGLGLLLPQRIPPGTVIRLRPKAANETTPWTEATVRTCRPETGQFEIGCQFHSTPTWSLLLQFG